MSMPTIKHRFVSYFIDVFVVTLITRLIVKSSVHFVHTFFFHLHPYYQDQVVNGFNNIIFPVFSIVMFNYFLFSYYWGEGRTIGCIMTNIEAINNTSKNEGRLSFKESFIRSLVHSFYFFSAVTVLSSPLLLIPLLRDDKKGLTELLSKTSIVIFGQDQMQPAPILLTTNEANAQSPQDDIPDNVIYLPYANENSIEFIDDDKEDKAA